jgi:peptide/nickel transport system substrate-binding protein
LDADNYIYPFLDCAKGSPETGCEEGGAQSQGSSLLQSRNESINLLNPVGKVTQPKESKFLAKFKKFSPMKFPIFPFWQTKEYAFARNGITGVIINPSQTFPFWTIAKKS